MYCGDETGAFIGDVGSKTSRFGYGGEDCPKVVIPSAAYKSISTDGNSNTPKGRKYKYSAPVSLMRRPPDNCFSSNDTDSDVGFVPIYSSMNSNSNHQHNNSNNIIQDIDAWGSLWEYSYSALCVRGKGKHTKGYQFNNEQELLQQGALKLSSQTISTQSSNNNIDIPIDHPLLAVDSTSRTISTKEQEKQRSQMLEVLYESLSAPASYIAPTPMLSSFAYGRQTALVVDIGHSGSSVTPVVDGYCLINGSVRSGRGGKWLGDVQQSVLEGGWVVNGSAVNKWNGWGDSSDEGKAGVPPCLNGGVVPRYLLRSATPQNKLQLLKQSSFHSMATQEVMYEMMTSSHILPLDTSNKKESIIPFCGYGKDGDDMAVDIDVDMAEEKKEEDGDESTGCYVLPDGTKVDLAKSKAGQDLRRLPELLFSETLPTFIRPPATEDINNDSSNMLSLQKLIHKSLTEILDIDLRKELSSNIILTGGVSLFPNLDKRLSIELGEVLPSSNKYKVVASKSTVENRYSAWIGGSILSSLGSFQQLWLSKKEYEECGAVLGLQRFGS